MNASRRSFLAAAAALPMVAAARLDGKTIRTPRHEPQEAAPRTPAASRRASSDPWVELNPAHVRHNVDAIARLTRRPILAVIKNNGYGAGVTLIGRALEALEPIAGLAVVKIDEAFSLRDAGVSKPILLMGPFDDAQLLDLAAAGIRPMVYTPPGPELERAAERLQRPVAVHVCVDTGIGRVGVPHREAAAFIRTLTARKSVRIEGTMMTFTEDAEFDREQLSRFVALTDGLAAAAFNFGMRHAASSYTLFQQPVSGRSGPWLEMVRPGMAIFGVYPEPQFRASQLLELRPAVALRARVVYVKQLRAGETAGYNRAYKAPRDVWIATLPVGHADGVPRVAAKGAKVRIDGRLYPIVASISASHAIVEVGPERSVEVGDEATLFDWKPGSRPEDVSAACGASVYDLLMHLNPQLDRRLVQHPLA